MFIPGAATKGTPSIRVDERYVDADDLALAAVSSYQEVTWELPTIRSVYHTLLRVSTKKQREHFVLAPNSRALIIRTPTQRIPNLWKQPCLLHPYIKAFATSSLPHEKEGEAEIEPPLNGG